MPEKPQKIPPITAQREPRSAGEMVCFVEITLIKSKSHGSIIIGAGAPVNENRPSGAGLRSILSGSDALEVADGLIDRGDIGKCIGELR